MNPPRYRCSVARVERDDPLPGTASTFRSFLLMEDPGPWGRDAWLDARLPDGLGREVIARSAAAGVRPLLVRREHRGHGAAPSDSTVSTNSGAGHGRRLFAAYTSPDGGWVQTTTLDDPREVLDLDLTALSTGFGLGLDEWAEPVLAVCTHGRHDACCAEHGRPVALALAAAEPDAAWGCSHMGGDRFAGNLLVLGEGLYYGGLDPASVLGVVAAHRAGHLDLDHLRGRTCWPMPVQAAEIELRRRLGLTERGVVELLRWSRDGALVTAAFRHPGRAGEELDAVSEVTVARHATEPVRLTCTSTRAEPAVSWRPVPVSS